MQTFTELEEKRKKLTQRVAEIDREMSYGVFHGDPTEREKIRKAITKTNRRLKKMRAEAQKAKLDK